MEVLRSFQREYALVMKRVGSQVSLFRAKFQTQLWTQLTPLHGSRTRQECLDLASVATLDTVALPVTAETTNQLLSAFGDIRLAETDNCPRIGKECALVEDGADFVVLPKDGPPLRITDTRLLKGIRNENAALLGWITSLLQVANNAQPQ